MKGYESLAHSRWDCTYHLVFVPKKRKQVLFGKIREFLGPVFRELARQKGHRQDLPYRWRKKDISLERPDAFQRIPLLVIRSRYPSGGFFQHLFQNDRVIVRMARYPVVAP